TLSDWEPGFAIAGINNPQFQRNPGAYKIKTVSLTTNPIRTIGGLTITPDTTIDKVSLAASPLFIVPGGATWDKGKNSEAAELARRFLEAGKTVAAICGATVGLAKAGLLDQRKHTSNSKDYIAATGYAGLKNYRKQAAVTDRGLITSPAMAPLEFAREIFAELGIYEPAVLEAWYKLYKTGDAKYFQALTQAGGA
ncbi:MAG: DJ-1/PfpI family protein, partial [Luteimonas sp.]